MNDSRRNLSRTNGLVLRILFVSSGEVCGPLELVQITAQYQLQGTRAFASMSVLLDLVAVYAAVCEVHAVAEAHNIR